MITEIVLASRNRKKIAEIESIFREYGLGNIRLLSLDDIGFTGDIEENGASFEENSKIKASVPASLGYYGIADDSGLMVDALDGRPGIYSARFSGEGATDIKNNEKLLFELKEVPDEKRTARFVSVISLASTEGAEVKGFNARGECEGIILHEAKGDGGFGYDPLFFYEPKGKTFAELTAEEKNSISHRAVALRRFAEKLASVNR